MLYYTICLGIYCVGMHIEHDLKCQSECFILSLPRQFINTTHSGMFVQVS